MLNTLKMLQQNDPSMKIVGSFCLKIENQELQIKDVDILTDDLDLYLKFNISKWVKKTPMSENGKRGAFVLNRIRFDVFQKKPHTNDVFYNYHGLSVLTKKSLIDYWIHITAEYNSLNNATGRFYAEYFQKKINIYNANN
ncbi:Uncharacterised protein [Weeksella virosa]|uniref:Uncharacterized protein n=2 Tax=Weeksella virosa TaxID=1014 RepID=F0NXR3_WEEVC|nr:hypothetical protein Weevi_0248 [Weeksella virosa DSM 16922]VEH63301.1 Uncharacterised protein [Weeksella virosa]